MNCKKCGKDLYVDEIDVQGQKRKMKIYRCQCGRVYLTGNFIKEILPAA